MVINNKKEVSQLVKLLQSYHLKTFFSSKNGAIIEEISSTHYVNDSFYSDESINANKNRKTILTDWLD